MTISEVITRLRDLQEEWGDIVVGTLDDRQPQIEYEPTFRIDEGEEVWTGFDKPKHDGKVLIIA